MRESNFVAGFKYVPSFAKAHGVTAKLSDLKRGAVSPSSFTRLMRKIEAFPSSVVYYFRDLLKSANRTFVRNKTFFGL